MTDGDDMSAAKSENKASHESRRHSSHSHLTKSASDSPLKSVCVVGLGYIGLPTASLLASRGYSVHGVDIREDVVKIINAGDIHISEPDLDVMVRSAVESKRLTAGLNPIEADIFIVAVPTPFKDDHEPDLSYVEAATRSIGPVVKNGDLVILESTSPVGTTEKVASWLRQERPDLFTHEADSAREEGEGIFIAHCPERVLPGQIMRELVENDRIVGGIDALSTDLAVSFYKTFVIGDILETQSRTAEMSKLAENTFRDINIAYSNELSIICEQLNIDVWELIRLANHHPRVNILQPGPGVGGHCIAVDPWFIVHSAPNVSGLIKKAREVNSRKPNYIVEKILSASRRHSGRPIACMGLSYKADIDDLRESPAVSIVESVCKALPEVTVLVSEPHIGSLPESLETFSNLSLVEANEAVQQAGTVALLVDHKIFQCITPGELEGREVIDTRGFWSQAEAIQ